MARAHVEIKSTVNAGSGASRGSDYLTLLRPGGRPTLDGIEYHEFPDALDRQGVLL